MSLCVKRVLYALLALCFAALLCGCTAQPAAQTVLFGEITDAVKVNPENLGIALEKYYEDKDTDRVFSRNPWDMITFDGCVYMGCGDYNINTGPCPIYRFEPENNDFRLVSMLNSEQISRFYIYDNTLTPAPSTRRNGE